MVQILFLITAVLAIPEGKATRKNALEDAFSAFQFLKI